MTLLSYIKRRLYPHQHPETALRYKPIVDLIHQNHWGNQKILEIGSGSYGITPYLKTNIVGIDFDFSEPATPLLHQVKGVGEKLPFKANEFDLVILSDVLEHIAAQKRQAVLQEALRVAAVAVIVGGPFGQQAFEHDQALAKVLDHPFLKEHLLYGLPNKEDLLNLKNPKITSIVLIGDYLNLGVRKAIMHLFAHKSKIAYYLYLKGLMPFIPLLARCNMQPCYRSLFLINIKK